MNIGVVYKNIRNSNKMLKWQHNEDMYKNLQRNNIDKVDFIFYFSLESYVVNNPISSSNNHFVCWANFEWENYICKETTSNSNDSAGSWAHYLDL